MTTVHMLEEWCKKQNLLLIAGQFVIRKRGAVCCPKSLFIFKYGDLLGFVRWPSNDFYFYLAGRKKNIQVSQSLYLSGILPECNAFS